MFSPNFMIMSDVLNGRTDTLTWQSLGPAMPHCQRGKNKKLLLAAPKSMLKTRGSYRLFKKTKRQSLGYLPAGK